MAPHGPEKMLAFIEVERLRSAQAVVGFKDANPDAQVDTSIFQEFIRNEQNRIIAARDLFWPGRPDVQHWSLLKDVQARGKARTTCHPSLRCCRSWGPPNPVNPLTLQNLYSAFLIGYPHFGQAVA